MLGNENAVFVKFADKLPRESGVYAVRNDKWEPGRFEAAMYDNRSLQFVPVSDTVFVIDSWRYLTFTEKLSVGLDQVSLESLGDSTTEIAMYKMLVFLVDVSEKPRTRSDLTRFRNHDLHSIYLYLPKLKALGVRFRDKPRQKIEILDWGMIDKSWAYCNYELLRRKICN